MQAESRSADHAESSYANGIRTPAVSLRHEPAHWHDYSTNAKMRWVGRPLLEVFVTEFRDRASEYYQWAIHNGLCTVNGRKVGPDHVLKQSDRITNRVHRHEPAVTSEPIRILYRNEEEGRLVVVKPGSIPVHPAGRYYKMTLLEMLASEHGITNVFASNRLDRLTSGIMVCSTRKEVAHVLSEQFAIGKVRKGYVCRVRGRFPDGEIAVDKPILHCDRQTGISIVHPMGKYCSTVFDRLSYDRLTDSSVVYCRPRTGRSHQLRVHLQYLGHPIINDPIYAHTVWSSCHPTELERKELKPDRWLIEPGSTLSVYGSQELDRIVDGLKMEKDNKDDWARWRDEVLFGELLKEDGVEKVKVPGPNAVSPASQRGETGDSAEDRNGIDADQYCQECRIPLVPDPKPEELFIYLHAIKYETDEWTYEDAMPWWALPEWQEGGSIKRVMAPALGLIGPGDVKTGDDVRLPASVPLVDLPFVRGDEDAKSEDLSSRNFPSLVVEVMGGMEDFAAIDLERHLCLKNGSVPVIRHSTHIVLPEGEASYKAAQLYLQGHVGCAKDAYLKIGFPPMPSETLSALAKEKKAMYDARSAVNHLRKKGKAEEAAKITSVFSSLAMDNRTALEEQLISAIQDSWARCERTIGRTFDIWQGLNGWDPSSLSRKPRFRATVDRRGYSLPTLTTTQMERELGELVWRWKNGAVKGGGNGIWQVDLLEPDLDVTLKMLPGHGCGGDEVRELEANWRTKEQNTMGCFAFMLPLTRRQWPSHRPEEVPNHLVHGGTALARFRAYTIAVACPLLSSSSREPARVWEPCAGTGSLAVELRAALEQRGVASNIFVSDVVDAEVYKAREMLDLCISDWKEKGMHVGTVDAGNIEDAVAFVGGEGCLDAIITDLPWGRRVLTHATIAKMYPTFLRTFARLLKPGAAALLMTAEPKTMLRAVKGYEAEARKRNWPFLLSVQRLTTEGLPENVGDTTVTTDDERRALLRHVHCGYDVTLVLLRKQPLLA